MKKAAQLRKMNKEELLAQLDALAEEGMKLRFQQASMQMSNTARPAQVRREIARINTILAERHRQEAEA